jgi:hypothetical protein
VAEARTDPRPVEAGKVPDVGPAVARHGDGQDVARIAPLEFPAQCRSELFRLSLERIRTMRWTSGVLGRT